MTKTIVQREKAFQISYAAEPNRCRFTYPVSAEFIKLTFSYLEEVREIDFNCIRGKFEKCKNRWYYVLDVKIDLEKPELDTYAKVQLYATTDFSRIQHTLGIFKISKENWDNTLFMAVYHCYEKV
jgi:hypothetical protein